MASGADRTIALTIVSPSRNHYEGAVLSAQIPMHDGLIGVLPGHAPLVGVLGFGLLTLNDETGRRSFVIDSGFVEINPRRITVLANHAEDLDLVDGARAEQDLQAAIAMHAEGEFQVQQRLDRIAAARTRVRHAPV